jgi:hypothetical protein
MDQTYWQVLLEQVKREPMGYLLIFLAGLLLGALVL